MILRMVALGTATTFAAGATLLAGVTPASAAQWNGPEVVTFKDVSWGVYYKVHTRQPHYVSDRYGTHVDFVYTRAHGCDFLDWASYQPGQRFTGAHYGWCN